MELIMTITDEQINELKKANNVVLKFKRITGINLDRKYTFGDTAISIDNVLKNGVYKYIQGERVFYYVVLEALDENLGFAYSFY